MFYETEREDAYRDAVENLLGSHLETQTFLLQLCNDKSNKTLCSLNMCEGVHTLDFVELRNC